MTGFIQPMYAAAMPKIKPVLAPSTWVAEEKYDGHRLIVRVTQSSEVLAWSRYGATRALPEHLVKALSALPHGVYDGELYVPGARSYGVTELVNATNLMFVAFDVLELLNVSLLSESWTTRRAYLLEVARRGLLRGALRLSDALSVDSYDDAMERCREIWSRGGEGVILKRKASRYSPGKRPRGDWMKIKDCQTAVLTVVGFLPSRGEVVDRGPYATVLLEDGAGHRTTVKTRNDKELAKLAEAGGRSIGRKLRIEYQERTPDGNYRHPRWDRWAEDYEEVTS